MKKYKTIYIDEYGEVETEITNDGKELYLTIDNIAFKGMFLDDFELVDETQVIDSKRFTLIGGALCNCELLLTIPVTLLKNRQTCIEAELSVHIILGKPKPNGAIEREEVKMELRFEKYLIKSQKGEFFEDNLSQIQRQLPPDYALKMCFGCMYADYSPYGQGLFGTMMCFRGVKPLYLAVESKDDMLEIHHLFTEQVQETHDCEEFEIRKKGIGYRG
jgi:hypothetical protein